MKSRPLRDRITLALDYLVERSTRIGRRIVSPWYYLGLGLTPGSERLLIAPQDIRTSDPTIGADICAGYFTFGGRMLHRTAAQGSPFEADLPSDAFARGLYGFGWLRHLRHNDETVNHALLLTDSFISGRISLKGIENEPLVRAHRLIALLSHSPAILEGADRDFYRRLMRYLNKEYRALHYTLSTRVTGTERLPVILALTYFELCTQTSKQRQRKMTHLLMQELRRQILPDGGHISRNPQPIVDLLLDLLPLRQAYVARGIEIPQALLNSIDRMMPMLRMFRHGDGSLALFNGMGATAPEALAIALAYDDARALPLANAPYSGYQRLEGEAALVMADCGKPPPRVFSQKAHAGCLSFELSSGEHKIIVNCGRPSAAMGYDIVELARSTAAHSTLSMNDGASCLIAEKDTLFSRQILLGPGKIAVERLEDDQAHRLSANHDGYRRWNARHMRRLALAKKGHWLVGEDWVEPLDKRKKQPTLSYQLRFHLHPSVQPQLHDQHSILLRLPDGKIWRFQASVSAQVEESIFFASPQGPSRSWQIVIEAPELMAEPIRWQFQLLEETPPVQVSPDEEDAPDNKPEQSISATIIRN